VKMIKYTKQISRTYSNLR